MQPLSLVSAWKTSEFWLTLLMHVIAGAVALRPVSEASFGVKVIALLSAGLGQCVFTHSRSAIRITLIASRATRTPPSATCCGDAVIDAAKKIGFGNALKPALNLILLGVLGASMLSLGACSPTSAYVSADAATYNAIAPEYLGYVNADANLSAAQKTRRQNTIATWQLRIQQSGVAVTPATQPTTQP